MTFHIPIRVQLRPSILDPQGKAIQHALRDLGERSVKGVRTGKLIELEVAAESAEAAEEIARRACEKLLANPVMEDFVVESAREA